MQPVYSCLTKDGEHRIEVFTRFPEDLINEDINIFADYVEKTYGSSLGMNYPQKHHNMISSNVDGDALRVHYDGECIGFIYFDDESGIDEHGILRTAVGANCVWMDTARLASIFLMFAVDKLYHKDTIIGFGPSENVWKLFHSWCTTRSVAAHVKNPSKPLIIDRERSRKKVNKAVNRLVLPYSCSGSLYRRRGFPADWDKTQTAMDMKKRRD